ncbi:hypothetical protein B0J13DRAFT_67245 [Dactylonectria estremocensis]|uniref:NACHT-NTPase and P-loop NTPases N-terminal domain-containing protein n=1 Tax=Dactylonectria estremocensis TaxID=1079267 RepID=A0A9P9EHL9_9HYPO|nr:hypothetical protein B0J13DRAFT_67245 [Dactylonectria estremocensis]
MSFSRASHKAHLDLETFRVIYKAIPRVYLTMDPVSAFGTTVGALQILDYSMKIIKTASKLIESPNGVPAEMHDMETAAQDLVDSIKRLSTDPAQEHGSALKAICASSCKIAEELLMTIEAVRVDAAGSKCKIVSRTFRTIRGENKTKALQDRLSNLRRQITTHIAIESK